MTREYVNTQITRTTQLLLEYFTDILFRKVAPVFGSDFIKIMVNGFATSKVMNEAKNGPTRMGGTR